jgi:predicted transposase/invertase (TIGR01784 family)
MAAANSLIHRVRQELEDEIRQRELLQLIETVLIYKLPQMTRQELEAMFTVSDLKQTKIYQEALEEGKLESVPFMLQLGATVEQIAQALDLPLEKVREVAQQQHNR